MPAETEQPVHVSKYRPPKVAACLQICRRVDLPRIRLQRTSLDLFTSAPSRQLGWRVWIGLGFLAEGRVSPLHLAVAQKKRNSKMGCPGKWKHGPKPAVCPSCLILSQTHFTTGAKPPKSPPISRPRTTSSVGLFEEGQSPLKLLHRGGHAPQGLGAVRVDTAPSGGFTTQKPPQKGFEKDREQPMTTPLMAP